MEDPKLHRNMTALGIRMEKRRKHLKKACRNFGLDIPANDTLHRPNSWEFLVNKEHRLVWCNVFKAASSSWMYNFNILAGWELKYVQFQFTIPIPIVLSYSYSPKFLSRTKSVPLVLARQRYPRIALNELREAMANSTSFIIVRHPLERLLSAYRDKIQNSLPNTHHRKLGGDIIKKYRKRKAKTAPVSSICISHGMWF